MESIKGERYAYWNMRKYRRMCDEKKKKKNERWEREIEEVKTKRQVWEVVGRRRRKKKK